ncbi:MAG: NAD(P)H-dependent oxidoreductase [Deltaproteobacteria bacterium]|nr:NAD(P)H-dependent oxidoreductase [Deltaproteobacteria bacterium]
MVYTPRLLAFAGSTRKESYNKKVLEFAVQGAKSAGAEVTLLDLRDLPLPLYDGDLEAESGLPENVKKLKSLMKAHEGFLIASPEYNSSISGVLKNAIDWASRPEPGEAPLACFSGKAAALLSATPGALAGLRGLAEVGRILHNIGVHVLPYQVGVPRVHEAFNPDGSLKDPKLRANLEKVGTSLSEFLMKHYV